MTGYEFGREFRLKILALMLDETWMARYGDSIIQPAYFERADEIALCTAITNYRQSYGVSPDDPYDVIELMGGDYATLAMDIYDGCNTWDLSLASDKVVGFAREQAARLAILDGVDDIEKGDIAKAIERMRDALKVGEDLAEPGMDPIEDVDQWLYDYWDAKIPTGMYHIDMALEGGLMAGELGIIMAPQNRGKSAALINIGHGGMSLLGGCNVVHLTHEMNVQQVAKRYAARIVFRFPKRGDNLTEYAEELVQKARKLLKGKVKIIGGAYKMTLPQIQGHIERLQSSGFNPGLLIDDYPDLIVPPRAYKDRRFELTAIYEELRGFSFKAGVPVWGASQATRGAYSKEVITLADIAEDIGKASTADVIISLCQTYDEEQVNRCRLFLAKVRDGESRAMIEAKYYPAQQAIITTGKAKMRRKKQDQEAQEADV